MAQDEATGSSNGPSGEPEDLKKAAIRAELKKKLHASAMGYGSEGTQMLEFIKDFYADFSKDLYEAARLLGFGDGKAAVLVMLKTFPDELIVHDIPSVGMALIKPAIHENTRENLKLIDQTNREIAKENAIAQSRRSRSAMRDHPNPNAMPLGIDHLLNYAMRNPVPPMPRMHPRPPSQNRMASVHTMSRPPAQKQPTQQQVCKNANQEPLGPRRPLSQSQNQLPMPMGPPQQMGGRRSSQASRGSAHSQERNPPTNLPWHRETVYTRSQILDQRPAPPPRNDFGDIPLGYHPSGINITISHKSRAAPPPKKSAAPPQYPDNEAYSNDEDFRAPPSRSSIRSLEFEMASSRPTTSTASSEWYRQHNQGPPPPGFEPPTPPGLIPPGFESDPKCNGHWNGKEGAAQSMHDEEEYDGDEDEQLFSDDEWDLDWDVDLGMDEEYMEDNEELQLEEKAHHPKIPADLYRLVHVFRHSNGRCTLDELKKGYDATFGRALTTKELNRVLGSPENIRIAKDSFKKAAWPASKIFRVVEKTSNYYIEMLPSLADAFVDPNVFFMDPSLFFASTFASPLVQTPSLASPAPSSYRPSPPASVKATPLATPLAKVRLEATPSSVIKASMKKEPQSPLVQPQLSSTPRMETSTPLAANTSTTTAKEAPIKEEPQSPVVQPQQIVSPTSIPRMLTTTPPAMKREPIGVVEAEVASPTPSTAAPKKDNQMGRKFSELALFAHDQLKCGKGKKSLVQLYERILKVAAPNQFPRFLMSDKDAFLGYLSSFFADSFQFDYDATDIYITATEVKPGFEFVPNTPPAKCFAVQPRNRFEAEIEARQAQDSPSTNPKKEIKGKKIVDLFLPKVAERVKQLLSEYAELLDQVGPDPAPAFKKFEQIFFFDTNHRLCRGEFVRLEADRAVVIDVDTNKERFVLAEECFEVPANFPGRILPCARFSAEIVGQSEAQIEQLKRRPFNIEVISNEGNFCRVKVVE